ncbi:hypothetical protein MJH12_09580, partial [bacterium]|nr:hypothetical protein [bacterium]
VSPSPYSKMFDDDYGFISHDDCLLFKWTGFGPDTVTRCFFDQSPDDLQDLHFLSAQDIEKVRIENLYPISKQEYSSNDKLIAELGQNQYVSFSKGCFLGYEILARIRNRGHTNKSLSLIEFDQNNSSDIVGEKLFMGEVSKGLVTSCTNVDDKCLALAYVPTLLKEVGKSVVVGEMTGRILK